MDEEEKYLKELLELRAEHSELNEVINRRYNKKKFNQLQLQRMKKRKLWIRDRIKWLEQIIYPDIIA